MLILLALLGALYRQILPELVSQWWDDANYSHGFVVPLISGFIGWRRRAELANLQAQGSWLGLAVLVTGLLTLALGEIAGELFLMRSSLIIVLCGLVLFHQGPKIFRTVAFPLGFLFFMVPLPAILFYAVAFPLQGLAARNAAWLLDLFGVPVLLDGNVIHLSQISLGVTEACSGVRSMISLLALAVGWGYVTLMGRIGIAVLTAAVVPVTIVTNAARIVATGLAGQWLGPEYAGSFYHALSGWLIFLFALALLLGLHRLILLAANVGRRRRTSDNRCV